MRRFCKRGSAFALAAVMLLSMAANGLVIHAQGADTGLCVHHTEHTPDCGYTAPTEGQECSHVCDADCYQCSCGGEGCEVVLTCTNTEPEHEHDASCYTCACASCQADETEPTIALNCQHQHDENCGYVEATAGTPCSYAVNGCPYCVTGWSWIDENQLLTSTDDGWKLLLPGASEQNLLPPDALEAMLPGQISAVTESGDTVPLSVTWDLTDLPEPMTEGEYTLTAALAETPENYALTEQAAPLSVTLQLGGAETYDSDVPSGTPPYEEYIVQGVSPNGTTINLFDYWVENPEAWDCHNPSGYQNMGINKNHALLFTYNMKQPADQRPENNDPVGNWNGWTGSSFLYSGIVQDTLVNGYPVLNLGETIPDTAATSLVAGRNGQESLAYLFDPGVSNEGKASYKNVRGLLQVDDDGYYYYDSQENYAVYYEDTNSFVLYEYPGVKIGNSQSEDGQFFPFDEANKDPEKDVDEEDNPVGLMRTNKSIEENMNHYFGIHMSTRFIQQDGGYVDETHSTPVTYEFSGDDDVWIFIDGKLAVDLGGLHNRASVEINFATGEIKINEGLKGAQTTSLKEKLNLTGSTFIDNTYHTLDFFYLERGNTDSNMKLKYNLVTIPESDLIKVDQLGHPVEDAEFTLYGAAEYEEKGDRATVIATGTTDENGGFVFQRKDENGNYYPVTINELYNTYGDLKDKQGNNLILVETVTPDGYRSVGKVGLYFYKPTGSEEVLMLSNSKWDKGAYAMPKVTATLPNEIKLLNKDPDDDTVTLTGTGAENNPLLFAVVYQKQEDGSWLPVYGDPLTGWTVQDNSDWNSILQAAQKNPYTFQLASSGAYQVEIENLPGDIKTYYHLADDKADAKYTIGYYYTEADQLEHATETNTWRINSELSDDYAIERDFAVRLYVPNIKNYLLVQKVNTAGTALEGATFNLYEASAVAVDPDDGSVTVDADATVYDTLTTVNNAAVGGLTLQGGGIFPTSNHVLKNGEYYLLESDAPTGYVKNDTAIHIVVDNTGVYANAGTAEDGVEVLRGVGSVVKSMVQFAVNDKVDTTLNGIKAALVTSPTYDKDGDGFTWTAAQWDETQGKVLHLQYQNAGNALDYGPYETNGALTLSTKEGWSKLLIQQCYQHDQTVATELKQELEDTDITNLFSGTCTVRVTDRQQDPDTGSLTVSKTVTGDTGDKNKAWTFTVTLKDSQDAALTGDVKYTGTGTVNGGSEGSVTPAEGKVTLQLKHNESITFTDLPEDTKYEVSEAEANEDGYTTTTPLNATGTIEADQNKSVEFVNKKETAVPATGNLTVSKTVTGDTGDTSKEWNFTVTLQDSNGTALTGAVEYSGSGTVTSGTGSSVTLAEGKVTLKLTHNQYITFTGLPAGTTYTVTETEDGQDGYTTTKSKDTGTITTGNTVEAAFTNTKNTTPQTPTTGSLTVSKTVTGNAGNQSKEWHFTVTLKDGNDALTGEYSYIGTGTVTGGENGKVTVGTGGTVSLKLTHNQSITFTDLPVGTTYTVTETEANQGGYSTSSSDETGTIEKDQTKTAAFTNEKNTTPPPTTMTGSLTVSKTVTGTAGNQSREWHFTVTLKDGNDALNGEYSYTGDGTVTGGASNKVTVGTGGTIEITLKHDQSITITDLPAGTIYTVTETEAGEDGYTTTVPTDAAGTIEKAVTKTAAFVNHKNGTTPPPPDDDDEYGKLTISKTVTGNAGDKNQDFTFTVTLTTSSGSQLGTRFSYTGSKNGTIKSGESITLSHGESIIINGIPSGTRYTVTETAAEGYTTTATGNTGTIPANGIREAAFVNAWTSPDEPDNPPDKPDNPPDEPDNPPDEPDVPSDPNTPKTGDSSLTGLWALLSLGSLAGLFLLMNRKLFYQGKHIRK